MQKNKFVHRVSGPGLQFSCEKLGFKTIVFHWENLPVKNNGFETVFFIWIFEEALNGGPYNGYVVRAAAYT